MTTQRFNPSVSVQPAPATTRRPTRRAAAVGVAAALLITAGTYGAARTLAPDSAPQPAHTSSPSPQLAREMHDVIVHLYGTRAITTPGPANTQPDSVTRQLRQTTIALYGPRH